MIGVVPRLWLERHEHSLITTAPQLQIQATTMTDKHIVKLLKRKRRAMNLPSSSEDDSSSSDGTPASVSQPPIAQPTTSSQQATPAPAPIAPTSLLAIESSSAAATSDKNHRAQFAKCFETSTKSNESVLSRFSYFDQSEYLVEITVEKQMNSWSSKVYKHLKMPPSIVTEGDVVKYVFVCKRYVWSLRFRTLCNS